MKHEDTRKLSDQWRVSACVRLTLSWLKYKTGGGANRITSSYRRDNTVLQLKDQSVNVLWRNSRCLILYSHMEDINVLCEIESFNVELGGTSNNNNNFALNG